MKKIKILIPYLFLLLYSYCSNRTDKNEKNGLVADSVTLVTMVSEREKAMQQKDLKTIMSQFADDATFVNSGGYYSANKKEIEEFHSTLTQMDSVGYHYKAGSVQVRILDNKNALVYYPWRMDWFSNNNPLDTINKEVGLMTLTAQKRNRTWLWIAITNQHTKEYFKDLMKHKN